MFTKIQKCRPLVVYELLCKYGPEPIRCVSTGRMCGTRIEVRSCKVPDGTTNWLDVSALKMVYDGNAIAATTPGSAWRDALK